MMTTDVYSGTALHCQTGRLSEQLPIWTPDMHGANKQPAARFSCTGALAFAGRTLRKLSHKVAECRRNRRARKELAAMSDLELADIGISRSEGDAIFGSHYESARLDPANVSSSDRCRYREPGLSTRGCIAVGDHPEKTL